MSGPMFVEERKMKILERIEENRKVTVAELCDFFGVSSATIRNDLRDLEASSQIIRTHGGAMVKSKTGLEPDTDQRGVEGLAEKKKIAEAAVGLIEDGDTIILDTGTTTLELARLLRQKRDITVVTNDLAIALLLEDFETVKVVFMGGIVRKRFHCTVIYGSSGGGTLSGLAVDTAFMGVNSFSVEKGGSTPDIHHAETKKLMMSIAAKVVLLFDSGKMGRTSFALFAPLESVDAIITDAIKEDDRKRLEENGVEVFVAAGA
jgi:DeoR family fructose operon transcriptional repressor